MKKWIRNTIGGLSLTSALFIFQACYGTPQDLGHDLLIQGTVTSKSTGNPIEGIRIGIKDDVQYVYTNQEGFFNMYVEIKDSINFSIQDIAENRTYIDKDTLILNPEFGQVLDIKLEEE